MISFVDIIQISFEIDHMGNNCCEVLIDTQNFKDYCSTFASQEYKPYLTKLQNHEIHYSGELNQQSKPLVLGNWAEGGIKTGLGIIFAHEKYYYQGPITEGEAQGVGRITWPNKAIFKGTVKKTKAEGQGELWISESKTKLKGIWQNGYPTFNHLFELKIDQKEKGTIMFINKDSSIDSEAYFSKQFIQAEIEFGSSRTYKGQLKKKKGGYIIQGKGKITYQDGSYYEGDLIGGRMHGHGKYYWSTTGHWYIGEYKSNFRDGQGKYFYRDDKFEEGQWNGGCLVTKPPQSDVSNVSNEENHQIQ